VAAELDNYLPTSRESCAVLKTDTGQWLFVSVNMADLYADMLKISRRGDEPLEVYGYLNEGVLPLLVFKAPADMELPSCEEGYFRGLSRFLWHGCQKNGTVPFGRAIDTKIRTGPIFATSRKRPGSGAGGGVIGKMPRRAACALRRSQAAGRRRRAIRRTNAASRSPLGARPPWHLPDHEGPDSRRRG